jgi:hypothetical protein
MGSPCVSTRSPFGFAEAGTRTCARAAAAGFAAAGFGVVFGLAAAGFGAVFDLAGAALASLALGAGRRTGAGFARGALASNELSAPEGSVR